MRSLPSCLSRGPLLTETLSRIFIFSPYARHQAGRPETKGHTKRHFCSILSWWFGPLLYGTLLRTLNIQPLANAVVAPLFIPLFFCLLAVLSLSFSSLFALLLYSYICLITMAWLQQWPFLSQFLSVIWSLGLTRARVRESSQHSYVSLSRIKKRQTLQSC